MKAYTLPAGAQLKDFDLTAATDTYKLVYNENDGYYHLNSASGPLVLVRLAEDCEYIACFKTMLDRSGVVKYFFDEDKKLEKKESYSECLLEYIKYVDEKEGVYPLNKDLEYIIKQRGDYTGWWNAESSGYIFKDIDGNILPGVTRRSAIELLKSWGYPVEERKLSIDEVIEAHKNGKLNEAFGTGTAAVISPIGELFDNGETMIINNNEIGAISRKLYDAMTGIQWGKCEDTMGWTERI